MPDFDKRPLGAHLADDGVQFRVWAPEADEVTLVLDSEGGERVPMEAAGHHYFEYFAEGLEAGTRYRFHLDDQPDLFPDPASRFQPESVHGPSEVIDPTAYEWHADEWDGIAQHDLVFYELHVGTFSPEGSFDGVRERLDALKDLGITAIELMPLGGFPGTRNWGYDPGAFFAPDAEYGRPDDLRRLVDAAHEKGLAVFLDVIYNHFGPDGAYAAAFAPFFTEKHETPWGQAVNLDDTHSAGVRHFFIQNALHWLNEYRFDGLRLDATFALVDDSETHFLAELSDTVEKQAPAPKRYLIAEDERNARHLLEPRSEGGYGIDGVWADDFHHQMRNLTAGDELKYFADFANTTAGDIAQTLRQGWYYTGQYADHYGEERGTSAKGLTPEHFVICIQNHDQVGNRPAGARLTEDISLPLYRAATAVLLFAPELPLLFMGQEWAASTPFQYFTDHHEELGQLVTEGRREEFSEFAELADEVPDPQAEATFDRSVLKWEEREKAPHTGILTFYRTLLHLRQKLPPAPEGDFAVEAHGDHGLYMQRGAYVLAAALGNGVTLPLPDHVDKIMHSEEAAYTSSGRTLQFTDDGVRFERPGALIANVR